MANQNGLGPISIVIFHVQLDSDGKFIVLTYKMWKKAHNKSYSDLIIKTEI